MAPRALPQNTLLGEIQGIEQEVVVGREREVVRNLNHRAEIARAAIPRRKESALALHRRIRMLEIGQIENRLPEELEVGILIGNGLGCLVMHNLLRAHTPQRRHTVIALTRRELRL